MSTTRSSKRFFSCRAVASFFREACAVNLRLLSSIFVAIAISSSVFASDEDRIMDASININNPNLSWTLGEMYDPLTGQMRYHMVDMVVEGNGDLPIVVSRSHGLGGEFVNSVFNSFAGYLGGVLDTPTISYSFRTSGALADCRDLYLTADSDNPHTRQHLRSFIKLRIGAETRRFFSTDPDDQPADISQFPTGANYVSADNWLMQCVDLDQNNHYEFQVQSPDGLTYVMNKMWTNDPALSDTLAQARVTSVRDAYGNTLTYEYENGNKPQTNTRASGDRLLRIVASDGRVVTFTYDKHGVLTRVASNGSPRPHIVEYEYKGLQPFKDSNAVLFEVHQNGLLTTKYYLSLIHI